MCIFDTFKPRHSRPSETCPPLKESPGEGARRRRNLLKKILKNNDFSSEKKLFFIYVAMKTVSAQGPIDAIGLSNMLIWTYKGDRAPPHQGSTGPFTVLKGNIRNTILHQVCCGSGSQNDSSYPK